MNFSFKAGNIKNYSKIYPSIQKNLLASAKLRFLFSELETSIDFKSLLYYTAMLEYIKHARSK
jgi:hypothetical protein